VGDLTLRGPAHWLMLPALAALFRGFPNRASASIDFVGPGDEIFCHCDQCRDGPFIMIRRGQPKAEISLPSEVVGTRHIEIPFDQDQLLNLRRVPNADEAGSPDDDKQIAKFSKWGTDTSAFIDLCAGCMASVPPVTSVLCSRPVLSGCPRWTAMHFCPVVRNPT
jgi:hypothetical protein